MYFTATGTTVAHYEYDAFGKIIVKTGILADTFAHRFSTKSFDGETGLYYYGYRYYNPSTGRWPSRDPIEEDGGINVHCFVGNDPVGKLDYLGLENLPVFGDWVFGTFQAENQGLPGGMKYGYFYLYKFQGDSDKELVQTVRVEKTIFANGEPIFNADSQYSEYFKLSKNGIAYDKHAIAFPENIKNGIYTYPLNKLDESVCDCMMLIKHTFRLYTGSNIKATGGNTVFRGDSFGFGFLDSYNGNSSYNRFTELFNSEASGINPELLADGRIRPPTGGAARGGIQNIGITHISILEFNCHTGKVNNFNKPSKSNYE